MRLTLMMTFAALAAAQTADLPLMPWPASVQMSGAVLPLDRGLRVKAASASPRLASAIERFEVRLAKKTGVHYVAPDAPALEIGGAKPSPRYPQLKEDESYKLSVNASGARLDAATETGVLRGLETVLQLAGPRSGGMGLAGVTVEDKPRFPWRGLLLDVARHWIPGPDVKRTLDGMAAAKLNVLHWHLSDDQGFRVESKRFPKLHTVAGEGKFYSQAEIAEILDYAAARGIRVVPEFDVPGHTMAWLAAYPEFGTMPGPYSVGRQWGIFDPVLDPTNDATYNFLDGLFGEMASLFPDAYFHVGGDEVNGKHWTASEKVNAFKKQHNLADNHALQAHFNTRLNEIVRKHGKIMMGWDEVLNPALPKDVLVQSWRGPGSLVEAARKGHSVLLSFGYYLDLMQPAGAHYLVDPLETDAAAYQSYAEFVGMAAGRGALPVKAVAKFAAEMKGVPPDVAAKVLGGEACLWAEFVVPANLDQRLWPRTAAVAERLWSPASTKDVWSMYRRLDTFELDLATVGITPSATGLVLRSRLTGGEEVPALETLASVVEPAKGYFRSGTGKYTSFTPLNRLVDSVPPESDAARRFGKTVRDWLAKRDAAGRDQITQSLQAWAGAGAGLKPYYQKSPLVGELEPVAAQLQAISAIGLEAVQRLGAGKTDAAWAGQQVETLNRMTAPVAEMVIAILPHVREMVQAAGK